MSLARLMLGEMEKRYLVYRSWNGQVHAEIQYGLPQTGEGVKKDGLEVQRIELLDHSLTLEQALLMYPYGQEVIRR